MVESAAAWYTSSTDGGYSTPEAVFESTAKSSEQSPDYRDTCGAP